MQSTTTVKNVRRISGALLVFSIFATGCGGNSEEAVPTPVATSTASDNGGQTSPAVPTPVEALDYSQNDKFGIVLSEEIRTDAHGEYRQLALAPDSPLLKYDGNLLDEHVLNAFTEDEVESAQKFITEFAVEQMDPTLLWDDTAEGREQWVNENIAYFSEEHREELKSSIINPAKNQNSVVNGNPLGWKDEIGEPIYVADEPRLAFNDARITAVSAFLDESANSEERLRFDFEFTVQEDAVDGNSGVITVRKEDVYALKRDGNGGWLINGWMNNYVWETTPADDFDPNKRYAQHSIEDVQDPSDGGE